MKSVPIVIALFAAGLAMQSSDAVAKQCKSIKVAATGFAESKGIAKSLAWEAWEAAVERRVHDKSFHNSDNVGSGSEECSPNKSGKYSGRGVIPSSMGHRGSAWVCEVSGTPCDGK
jgi:hypothetical protein